MRYWRSVLALSMTLVAGIGIGLGHRVLRLEKLSTTLPRIVPAPDFRAARDTYPYSLIPGGVRSGRELSESLAHDPVLAEHYRDVRPAAMLPLRLTMDLDGYVSYRLGNRIYWTSHLVRIRKGELVLTDGHSMIRGRCGNQIVPAYLRPKGIPTTLDPMEPPPAIFEAGIPPVLAAPRERALLADNRPPLLPAQPLSPGAAAPPTYWPPILPPIGWCCSGATSTGAPTPGAPFGRGGSPNPLAFPPAPRSVPDVPSPVPEPSTLLLVGVGIAGLKLFGKKS